MACAPPEVPNAKPRHRKQRVLFDSLTLHFSFAVFVEQFLNHMLFPLLLPWMVYKNGWNCLIAQGFIPIRFKRSDIMLALWHWFSPVMFYHVVFVHFLNICHVKISIMYPVIFYTMHRSMVALKYATLSPSELRRLLRGSNLSDADVNYKWPSLHTMKNSLIYQLQSMIISGYITISSSMINLEIVVAGARAGIALRDIYFEISDPRLGQKETLQLLRWQVFLSKALHIPLTDPADTHAETTMHHILVHQADGSYRVNIHSVCVAIVHATCQCSKKGRNVGFKYILLLALGNTAIPACMAEQPNTLRAGFFVFSVLFMNLIYYTVMLNILYAAVQEIKRKSCFADILESMIRLHDYNLKANVRFGAGGKNTDDRVITSEIKTIQDLICENTDMIRLSSGGCAQCVKEEGEVQEEVELPQTLRTSLLSHTSPCDGGNLKRALSTARHSEISAALLDSETGDDVLTDPDSDSSDSESSTDPVLEEVADVESAMGTLREHHTSTANTHPHMQLLPKGDDIAGAMSFYFHSNSSLTEDSSVDVPDSNMADFHFPQIEFLQYKDNFTTWMQCLKILHNFGYRFSFRLNALVVVILVLLLSLSLWVAADILTSHDTNPLKDVLVLQTVMCIVVYACTLAYIIFVAHVTNLKNIAHRETINTHMLNMTQTLRRTPDTDTKTKQNLTLGIDAAYAVTHSISIMNEVHPIRIFGVVANARTSAFIIYVLVVSLYVLFQYSSSGQITVPT